MPESRAPKFSLHRSLDEEREALAAIERRIAAQNAELERASAALARIPPSFAFSDAGNELVSAFRALDAEPLPGPSSSVAPPMFGTRC